MSTQDPYPYDEDEFDALGDDRVPQGVHRAPVPWWRQALPFLVVLILAPILAFVVVQAVSDQSSVGPEASPTVSESTTGEDAEGDADGGQTEEPSDEPTETEDPTETAEPTDELTEEPSETVDLDQGLNVWVLNGAGVVGLAGETAGILGDAGWSNVVADDYGFNQPTDSTIYYRDAEMAEEAEAIGEEVGISTVVEDASAAPNGIYVVLRPDFVN
ncbi:LytR C-terminal domain-containing protein [Ruania alba]|uniref:LytR cell envelope-related transcriptional attenuator n=1 Tax=Ruania alba TaxID=648782 RepID=A0A1H5MX17_9MICO|nr:LytR C-terminal domain-containing protein [Ruania alba]SEE92908.1 LytR cell envelope-related transcriptional attenuator [Ruania alba]